MDKLLVVFVMLFISLLMSCNNYNKDVDSIVVSEIEKEKFNSYHTYLDGSDHWKTIRLISHNTYDDKFIYSGSIVYKFNMINNSLIESTYKEQLEQYNLYMNGGYKIDKILIGTPLRIFRDFLWLDNITISIYVDNKIYTVRTNRTELEEYFGINFKELNLDNVNLGINDSKWVNIIVDPIIYNKETRNKYINKFVIVKTKSINKNE